MLLRSKTLVIVLTVVVLYGALAYAIQRGIVHPSFAAIEQDEAKKDMMRCVEALRREIHRLDKSCRDWAAWEDTYEYVAEPYPQYTEDNLAYPSFAANGLNSIFLLDTSGRVVWGKTYDLEAGKTISVAELPNEKWPETHPLLQHEFDAVPLEDTTIAGVMMSEHGPMLIASRPILHSENGGPVRGTMVMARLLNNDSIARIAERTEVDLKVFAVNGDPLPKEDSLAFARISAKTPFLLRNTSAKQTQVHTTFPDITGKTALLLRADVPRDITARGQALLRVTTVSIIAIGLTILLALTLMLQHTVIGPIERLAKDASEIGHSDDLTKTLSLQTGDEIGTLAEEFNGVVRKLARARTELLDASRRAGIAEVASGVLHNVGNVLTGANVAAATVTDDVKRSKVAGLTKATELLEEHRDNLAEFITSDERGKHLPGYLIKLAEHLDEEQKGILGELDVLSRSIEHVAQIIQTQQAFANPAGVPEAASPTDLAAAALAMVEVALARHHVKVTQNFGEVAPVKLDRAKTLQILVNLLTNAAEALESVERDKRHLSLGVRSDPPSRIVFEVTDSGPGIPQEDLTKIFQEGFTTKSDGQGYGLHYGACTAKEMGGSLTAASDGPGRGSTFTLVLPVEQVTETIKA